MIYKYIELQTFIFLNMCVKLLSYALILTYKNNRLPPRIDAKSPRCHLAGAGVAFNAPIIIAATCGSCTRV